MAVLMLRLPFSVRTNRSSLRSVRSESAVDAPCFSVPADRALSKNTDTILIFRKMERVVGGLVFEESEGGFEEFVEDGEEDGHFGFA